MRVEVDIYDANTRTVHTWMLFSYAVAIALLTKQLAGVNENDAIHASESKGSDGTIRISVDIGGTRPGWND